MVEDIIFCLIDLCFCVLLLLILCYMSKLQYKINCKQKEYIDKLSVYQKATLLDFIYIEKTCIIDTKKIDKKE